MSSRRFNPILASIGAFAIFLAFLTPALASTGSLRLSGSSFPDFTFQIPFGSTMTSINGQEIVNGTAIATYIITVYTWAVAFAAVLAVLAFTYAGVLWLIAGGDAGKVTESKKVMGNASIGLVIALCSYTLLWMIKPELVQFGPISVTPINSISMDLSPSVAISTGGTLIRSSCRGTKKEGDRCSADKACECESGVCTVGGVCGGLKVKEPEKLAKEKGLCCFVIDNAGSKTRRQRDVNNSKACLDMIRATDHVSMTVDRFFCPNITGVTVPHCWKKDVGSGTDPGYYERSTTLCKTYIDFNTETDPSTGKPTGLVSEPGKPTGFVNVPGPCSPTALLKNTVTSLFGMPAYAATSTAPCPVTMMKFGLPHATAAAFSRDRSKADMLWDLNNGGVKDGIKKAARALSSAHPAGGYDYEGLIGMWASHEMQFNQYGSACGGAKSTPLNQDCDWGWKEIDGRKTVTQSDHYQVGLGVHTEQIVYLKEAFQKVYGGTDVHLVRAAGQSVIDRSGKGAFGPKKKGTHATLKPEYISKEDFNTITSIDTLISNAKRGDKKSRREVVTLMRDPAIGAYLIGMHLTRDFDPSKLGTIMTRWGSNYQPELMSNLFAGYFELVE